MSYPACKYKKIIAEAIKIGQNEEIDRFLFMQFGAESLGPASDRARDMQLAGDDVTAR